MVRPTRRGVTGVLVAGGVLWALLAGPAAATTTPSTPSTWSLDGVGAWYEQVGPASALEAIVRGGAVIVASWLLVACLLQAAVELRSLGWLRPLADAVAPRALLHLVRGVAGMSVAAGVALPAPGASLPGHSLPGPAAEVVIMQSLGGGEDPPDTVTMTPLDDAPDPVLLPVDEGAVELAAEHPETVVVEPGDSLWSLAEAHLAEVTASTPSDAAVAQHWAFLIELNADRLVDPGNADLIFPGQELLLPPA